MSRAPYPKRAFSPFDVRQCCDGIERIKELIRGQMKSVAGQELNATPDRVRVGSKS